MTPQPAKPRVLIVDDHPANRQAFESLLENDYTLGIAATGRQALELALREDYAVVLLDVKMPGMDGFEVAELLRKRERSRHTPIIFMSAYDQTVIQAKKGYVAGATDFLFSPVDEELLKFKVASYVEMYLRNEALRLQIYQLQQTVLSLEAELARRPVGDDAVKKTVRVIEAQISDLRRRVESAAS
jgi:CheY-like chemotaxis protein